MEFSPTNIVVQHCIQGMIAEAQGNLEEASRRFHQAWDEATHDLEKFIAAHHIGRLLTDPAEKLKWLEIDLQLALSMNDEVVQSALAPLYASIAQCYEELGDLDNAKKNLQLSASSPTTPTDKGPFFHGTKADLKVGDMLTAGWGSNYEQDLIMNHIYFTALPNGAGLAASLAKGEGRERVYAVEPTGNFEDDPNVTNKKFPGNPTRSYRTELPLKVIGEVTDWTAQTDDEIKKWKQRLDENKGEIIN